MENNKYASQAQNSFQLKRFKYCYTSSHAGMVIDKSWWNEGKELLYTCQETPMMSSFNKFPKNLKTKSTDLLLTRNATPYIFIPEVGSIFSNVVQKVTINTKNYSIKFLQYALSYATESVKANGNTIPSWNMQIWDNLYLPLPDIQKQKQIADFLDDKVGKIEKLIELYRNKIAEMNNFKFQLISKVVSTGLNVGVCYKNTGNIWIPKIPKHWCLKRAKYVFDVLNKGNGITKEQVYENGDTPCIRYGEIYTKYNYGFFDTYSRTNKKEIDSVKVAHYGDILFTGTGELIEEIGKNVVYLGNDSILVGGDIIIGKHHHNPIFLNLALLCPLSQEQKGRGKSKLKVVHISAAEIGNIILPVPPRNEQDAIADYLNKKIKIIESITNKYNEKISTLKKYKKSLIYEYVSGKKEVTL